MEANASDETMLARSLEQLLALDSRLGEVARIAGPLPVRRGAPGLRGLVGTVIAQQVSKASATAILNRFALEADLDQPHAILALPPEAFRRAGLSAAKVTTVRALADAIVEGRLDLATLPRLDAEAAVAGLSRHRGIGRWTAECFLLFSLGHEDVFPAGDLALQAAVSHAFNLPVRIRERPLTELALNWSPHRSVAAQLFWRYYHATIRPDAAPV